MTPQLSVTRTNIAVIFGVALGLLSLGACNHLPASPAQAHGHDHEHAHDGQAAAALVLNNGAKWEIDAPLRAGMQRIQVLAAPLRAGQSIDPAQANKISTGVREQIAYLIDNCKLNPQADAVLHTLIAELIEGANALSTQSSSEHGVTLIRRALEQYPRYFDHPDWPAAVNQP